MEKFHRRPLEINLPKLAQLRRIEEKYGPLYIYKYMYNVKGMKGVEDSDFKAASRLKAFGFIKNFGTSY